MKFKEGVQITTTGFWNDVFEGYINPHELLSDEYDAIRVCEAISILEEFNSKAHSQNVIADL